MTNAEKIRELARERTLEELVIALAAACDRYRDTAIEYARRSLTPVIPLSTIDSGVQQTHEKITIEPDPALLSRAAIPAAPQGRTRCGGGQ